MSLLKAIANGREHRKGYAERGKPGRYDHTCRPHGGGYPRPCPRCERDRLFHVAKERVALQLAKKENDMM